MACQQDNWRCDNNNVDCWLSVGIKRFFNVMNVKNIEVERVDSLDSMSLEDVSEYLEQNSEKHSI